MKPLLMMRTRGLAGPLFAKHANCKTTLSASKGNSLVLNSTKSVPTGYIYKEAILSPSGDNFAVGTALGIPHIPNPRTIPHPNGLDINYLGSFGQAWWNLRMGVNGTDKIPNAETVDVSLSGTLVAVLTWHEPSLKYQASAGTDDLWAILGPQEGQVIDAYIKPNYI